MDARAPSPHRSGAWRIAMWASLLLACVWAVLLPHLARAADTTPGDVLPVPPLSGHVIDQTRTLSADQAGALEAKLSAFEQARGSQMVILMVPTTQPEDIATYAQRVGDTWKIGRRDVGDGLLLIVAKQDRRVRIEVAKALEGAVPDLAASQIIERAITPAFKAGDFAGGLNLGVDQLIARIQGENLPLPSPSPSGRASSRRGNDGFQFQDLLVFGLIGVPILSGVLGGVLGRKAGALTTGLVGGGLAWVVTSSVLIGAGAWVLASLLALVFGASGRGGRGGWGGPPMGGGWGGGGWGGGGGGGWSSGGGGDFGGGGASGRW